MLLAPMRLAWASLAVGRRRLVRVDDAAVEIDIAIHLLHLRARLRPEISSSRANALRERAAMDAVIISPPKAVL